MFGLSVGIMLIYFSVEKHTFYEWKTENSEYFRRNWRFKTTELLANLKYKDYKVMGEMIMIVHFNKNEGFENQLW